MTNPSHLKACSLFLVQYVPDAVRGESVNIGVFLYCAEEKYLGCLFTDDMRRVKRFHPQADLELLGALQQDFEQKIDEHGDNLDAYLRDVQASLSNLIQVAPPRTCLLADPPAEIQDVFARYVGPRLTGPEPQDTRLRVKQRLTTAFVRAGVWQNLQRRVPAAQWTQPGDPFTLDFGYRPVESEGKPNGHLKFIHALSLKRDADLAKVLVYTLDHIRRKEAARLTAVVEALAASADEAASLSQRILEEGRISLQPIAGVAEYAQSVRRELM